jgi:hypothetical protein
MSLPSRSFFLTLGVVVAIAVVLLVFRQAKGRAMQEKPAVLRTATDDIQPGSYRLLMDLYGKAPNAHARRLLFLRKSDGTLKTWYFPIDSDRRLAAPDGDWFVPGLACDPFEFDLQREEIRCKTTDADANRTIQLRWSWDGKSSGPLAPDMRAVPGHEAGGTFVFDPAYTVMATPNR